MPQVKIFIGIENNLHGVEQNINAWLASGKVRVVQMVGNLSPQSAGTEAGKSPGLTQSSFAPSDIFVMFLYEPVG